jgi:hypothetical protein
MDIPSLTGFFMWCSIINGGFLLLWTGCCIFAPNLVYRTQSRWFSIPRESFDVLIYAFIGLFKIFFLVFNLVPFLALTIIA